MDDLENDMEGNPINQLDDSLLNDKTMSHNLGIAIESNMTLDNDTTVTKHLLTMLVPQQEMISGYPPA